MEKIIKETFDDRIDRLVKEGRILFAKKLGKFRVGSIKKQGALKRFLQERD